MVCSVRAGSSRATWAFVRRRMNGRSPRATRAVVPAPGDDGRRPLEDRRTSQNARVQEVETPSQGGVSGGAGARAASLPHDLGPPSGYDG